MNRQRVIDVIDFGLSSYIFSERHKHVLLMQLNREKLAGRRKSIYMIAIVLLVVIAFVIALFKNKP